MKRLCTLIIGGLFLFSGLALAQAPPTRPPATKPPGTTPPPRPTSGVKPPPPATRPGSTGSKRRCDPVNLEPTYPVPP